MSKQLINSRRWIFTSAVCLALAACEPESNPAPDVEVIAAASAETQVIQFDPALVTSIRQFVGVYLEQIEEDSNQVSTLLEDLDKSVTQFLGDPDIESLNAVRSQWLNAHNVYELTTLHRYFADQILSEQDSLDLFQLNYQINHWPILPGYLDSVAGYGDSGIVHDINVPLDAINLRAQHGLFDLSEVTIGFHALEFMLWGENEDKRSPRPASDYVAISQLNAEQLEAGIELQQLPNNRRRMLLSLQSRLLADDFASSRALWQATSADFDSRINNISPDRLVSVLIDAINSMLTEELLVRSLYPMLNGDYIDSVQSPYSHSSQNAVSAQLSSIERLLRETGAEAGLSLDQMLSSLSPQFEEFFYQNFDSSKECLVLLFSTFEAPEVADVTRQSEFEVVECINLLTNMIDHLEQIKNSMFNPV